MSSTSRTLRETNPTKTRNNYAEGNRIQIESISSRHRSNSAPKRSSQIVAEQASSSLSNQNLQSSAEEQNSPLTYEEAVKKLNELSPKSKGILKTIMKTITNNNSKTNIDFKINENNKVNQDKKEISSPRKRTNNKEKMATVNFEPIGVATPSSSAVALSNNREDDKTSLRKTISSIPEVTKRNSHSLNRVVTLNVGGHLFQTTSKTLRSCESLFSLVFSDKDTVLRDENGHVFIDRDAKYFRYILNYLRDGKLVGKWNEIESDLLEKIIHEAIYFKLPGIINDIEECRVINASFDPNTLEEDCQLRFYNQEVVKKSETGSLFACMNYHFNKKLVEYCTDPYRYFVKFLLRYGESSNLAIGVTCKQTNRWNRFEVLKKIKEKDTIAIWYNYQEDHLVLYWNNAEVQRKTFKINSHDWVFHVEMFPDDNFCGLKIVEHQGPHPSQLEQNEDENNI